MVTKNIRECGHGVIWMALVFAGFLGFVILAIHGAKLRHPIQAIAVAPAIQTNSPWAVASPAVVGLNPSDCVGYENGVIFGGTANIHILGGGVWTNGCLRGSSDLYSVTVGGFVSYAGEISGSMLIDPAPIYKPFQLPYGYDQKPPPDCDHPDAHHISNLFLHNGTLVLDPGLYCIDGDIKISGGDIVAVGVTFYLPNGDVDVGGNADVTLISPEQNPDPSPAVSGMLFYVAAGNVSVLGNNTSQYVGLIDARDGSVIIRGAYGTTPIFETRIIGWNVDIGGNANIDIIYHSGYRRLITR